VNISVWSSLNDVKGLNKKSDPNEIQSNCSIRYDIIQQCFVGLSLYTLDGQLKGRLVSEQQYAGAYSIRVQLSEIIGTAVYKCKLITGTDSLMSTKLFQDSIYVVLWQPDPSQSFVGKTDTNGNLKITDKSLFPFFYELPPIPHTGEDGPDTIGYITFSDNITIALSDELYSNSISYDKVIKDGANVFQLEWDTNNAMISTPQSNTVHTISTITYQKPAISKIDWDWKLYQNYPNPFN